MKYWTIDDILAVKPSISMSLFMRHAERFPLKSRRDVIEADLTANGFQQAFQYGQQLGKAWQIESVFSSPIQRCINTAQEILNGAGVEKPIHLKWWLFSPFLQAGGNQPTKGASVRLFSSRYDMNIEKVKLAMMLQRTKTPTKPGRINLYVAHDTTILPVLAYLLDLDEVDLDLVPGFLEGILLQENHGKVALFAQSHHDGSNRSLE